MSFATFMKIAGPSLVNFGLNQVFGNKSSGRNIQANNQAAQIQAATAMRVAQIQAAAIKEGQAAMAGAIAEAAGLAAAGQAQAAAARIQAAKLQSAAILQAAELAAEVQREFFAIADRKLEPFRAQGLVAQDEYASMLGIPNADGELEPYDINRLREETPGYAFALEEGTRALDRAAPLGGGHLSGRHSKDMVRFAVGLSDQAVERKLNALLPLIENGRIAAGQLATIAGQTGQGLATTATRAGEAESKIQGDLGEGQARDATNLGNALAELALSGGKNAFDSALALGANRAGVYSKLGDIESSRIARNTAQRNERDQNMLDALGPVVNAGFEYFGNRYSRPNMNPWRSGARSSGWEYGNWI